jgi:hypothetical protein
MHGTASRCAAWSARATLAWGTALRTLEAGCSSGATTIEDRASALNSGRGRSSNRRVHNRGRGSRRWSRVHRARPGLRHDHAARRGRCWRCGDGSCRPRRHRRRLDGWRFLNLRSNWETGSRRFCRCGSRHSGYRLDDRGRWGNRGSSRLGNGRSRRSSRHGSRDHGRSWLRWYRGHRYGRWGSRNHWRPCRRRSAASHRARN